MRDEDLIVVNVVTISHLLSYTYIAIAGVASIIALAFIITQIYHRRKRHVYYSRSSYSTFVTYLPNSIIQFGDYN